MELRVFDRKIEPLGAIDEITSLIWRIKYFDVGTFSLMVPVTDNNRRLVAEGNILTKHDGKKEKTDEGGGIWRRAAQITYMNISKDGNGMEQIEAQGYMLSRWLDKRCIYPRDIFFGISQQNIINKLIAKNCGDEAEEKRRFPQFCILGQEKLGETGITAMDAPLEKLGQEVKERAQADKLGYDILLNEREKKYGFYLYKGKELTAGNNEGNAPCIFSRDLDNVDGQEYTASIENVGNYVYVRGIINRIDEEAVVGETDLIAGVDGEGASGLDLEEVFCDATDIARTYRDGGGTEITIPFDEYWQMLRERGIKELSNYGKIINFTGTINTNSNLKFKDDFNLGDRVTCIEKKWGIRIDARVTEAEEVFQEGKEAITITFGDSLPTLAQQIRKAR